MNKTGIEYLDYTWNTIAMRCTPISEGCKNCWHITRAKMLAKNPNIPEFAQDCYSGELSPRLITERLDGPSRVKKSSRIGVQFMGDLFHDNLRRKTGYGTEFEMVFQVYNEMLYGKGSNRHTFMVLTKRPKNAAQFYKDWMKPTDVDSHIWLGVSLELQKHEQRIVDLLQIPAAVRFISAEPMLGPVSLSSYLYLFDGVFCGDTPPKIDFVACGPETGPGARECKPEWIEDLYEQCKAAGVPFFDKRENYLAREFPK